MERASQLCLFPSLQGVLKTTCGAYLCKYTDSLIGIDVIRFYQEFPTPGKPSYIGFDLIDKKSKRLIHSDEMPYGRFVHHKSETRQNSAFVMIMNANEKGDKKKKQLASLILHSNDMSKPALFLLPGDTSPEPFRRREFFSDVRPMSIVRQRSTQEYEIQWITGKYWDLWDTTKYVPWILPLQESLQNEWVKKSDVKRAIEFLETLSTSIIEHQKSKGNKYPFSITFRDVLSPEAGTGLPDVMFTLFNTVTGIYNRDEYGLLYITRICYSKSPEERRQERLRQARLLSGGKLPYNKKGTDLAKFDEYDGDWGDLRAVFCLVNMQDQSLVKNKEDSLPGEDEIMGDHWVLLVFTTGTLQDFNPSNLERRKKVAGRAKAKERRMYMIDPYVLNETRELGGIMQYVKTESYGNQRQNVLNRACWQCAKAGILSYDVVCTSGYSPKNRSTPHRESIYPTTWSEYGNLDYLLPFTVTVPPKITNEIYYDRKVLIIGTSDELKGSEKIRERTSAKGKVAGHTYSMVVENLYPTCLLLYETTDIIMTPWIILSVAQALINADMTRDDPYSLFPYETSQIFFAMSRLSSVGLTAKDIYEQSKNGIPLEYDTYYSPYGKYSYLYEQVSLPVLSMNLKLSTSIYKHLFSKYE